MLNDALSVVREPTRKGDLLSKSHLEDLVGVIVHERRPPHDELIGKDAKGVPIGGAAMPHVQNDLGWDVFWRSTQRIGTIPCLETLDEAEVCQLDEPAVTD